ncbi:endonuclease/exonuclease/phosphatase family protein [Rudanella lutea]|uniref:endonuclease/exonuclease/phosphatase family protein n=1 Tax=Rudanella lutea TaxID=451374 RepID=UPI000382518B|nr:endonuclease/exonuclease/phosphatase family protein [Rudanella lutea]
MNFAESLFLGYGLFVGIASFLNLIRLDYWWIRMWDFPHFQLMVLAAVGLVAWLIFQNDWTWPQLLVPTLLTAALAYQGWLIYPYTFLHRVQVPRQKRKSPEIEANGIRLLIANVFMDNTQCPDVCRLISKHKPDIVLILEGNETWRQALSGIEPDYPYRQLIPLENTYGMLFYSRLPMRATQVRFQIQDDIPSIYTQLQLPSGKWIHFYGVHPMPPSPTEHYRSTERDAELLLVGREARSLKGPIIVAGDLNDVAWSHTTRLFGRVSGLLDPRIGRGLFSTFHAKYFFLRWPLDHVFVSHHFTVNSLRRMPNCGSDHFPILVALTYAPDPQRIDEVPEPEGNDLEEAKEKITEALSANQSDTDAGKPV